MILDANWMGGTLVASGLLMAAVLLLRRPVARLSGAKVAYALWALPALRIMLPRLPSDWALFGSAAIFDPAHMIGIGPVAVAAATPALPLIAPAFAATVLHRDAIATPSTDWLGVAFAVWAAGAALHFGWQLLAYRVFLARSLHASTLLTRAAGIEVRLFPSVEGPMATGVLRRRILLPLDFTTRFLPEERRLALAHETAHHCRGDLIANLAGAALLSLHWFNPLAHWAYRAFRDDQEAACDATVLGAEAIDRRLAYGNAILKSASCRVPGAACALNHAGALKRRINIMIDGRKNRALRLGGAALALAVVTGGLIGTASTVAATDYAIHVDRHGHRMIVTENGRTRPATPAEEALARHADQAARTAQIEARRDMRRADRDVRVATAEMRTPIAPRAPLSPRVPQAPAAPHAPDAPRAPLPPSPPVNDDGYSYFSGDKIVDRVTIRADIDAAMVEAEGARVEAQQARRAALVEVAQARAEGEQERRQALVEADQARREALAEAVKARREAQRAAAEARRATR